MERVYETDIEEDPLSPSYSNFVCIYSAHQRKKISTSDLWTSGKKYKNQADCPQKVLQERVRKDTKWEWVFDPAFGPLVKKIFRA